MVTENVSTGEEKRVARSTTMRSLDAEVGTLLVVATDKRCDIVLWDGGDAEVSQEDGRSGRVPLPSTFRWVRSIRETFIESVNTLRKAHFMPLSHEHHRMTTVGYKANECTGLAVA